MNAIPYVPHLACCSDVPAFWFAHYVMVEWFGGTDADAWARALADGRPIALDGRKTYPVSNVTIGPGTPCPGIFSIGGTARVVPDGANPNGRCFLITKPADFIVSGVFFDMPISTDPNTAPPWNRALYFEPTGGTGTNYRVEGCFFSGGVTAIVLNGVLRNCRIAENYITGTFGNGISVQACDNVQIVDNILEDGGYGGTDVPGSPSGAIRVGYSLQLVSSRNVTIARNTISNYCVPSRQSSIDCFSGSGRNFSIVGNVLELNGGGIELKTQGWDIGVPDIYRNHLVASNVIRVRTASLTGNTTAITMFYAAPIVGVGKAGRVLVIGNMIAGVGTPDGSFGVYGVSVGGWDNALIASNHIMNVTHGILVNGAGDADGIAHNISITGNEIDAVTLAVAAGSATEGLRIVGNPLLRSVGSTPAVLINTATNVEILGNFIEGSSDEAIDLRDVHGCRIAGNGIKANGFCVFATGAASDGVRIVRNYLTSATGPAVSLGAGSTDIVVRGNEVDVPIGSRTVTGTGTWAATNNYRGMATSDPTTTAGGSLGDIFDNPAAGAGDYGKWRCTTAGAAGVAVYKGADAIAA